MPQPDIKAQIRLLPADRLVRFWKSVRAVNELLDNAGIDALLVAEYCALVREAKVIADSRFAKGK